MVCRWACRCPNKHGIKVGEILQFINDIPLFNLQCPHKIFQLKSFLWKFIKNLFILFKAQVPSGMTEPNLIHWLRCFVSFDFLRFFFLSHFHYFFRSHTTFVHLSIYRTFFVFVLFIHTLHNPHTWILDCKIVLVRCEKIERGNAIERQNVR